MVQQVEAPLDTVLLCIERGLQAAGGALDTLCRQVFLNGFLQVFEMKPGLGEQLLELAIVNAGKLEGVYLERLGENRGEVAFGVVDEFIQKQVGNLPLEQGKMVRFFEELMQQIRLG